YTLYDFVDVLHRPAAADDVIVPGWLDEAPAQLLDLLDLTTALDGPFDERHQFFKFDGLRHEIEGARLGSLDRLGHRAIPGDHNYLRGGRGLFQFSDQFDPIDIGEFEVGQHDLGTMLRDHPKALRPGFRRGHFIAVFLQVEPGQVQHLGIVINDQNFCFAHHTSPITKLYQHDVLSGWR